jgi:predicted amidohydrolase
MNVRKPMIAAVAQLRSTSNKFENLKDIAHCAKLAIEQNACMLFLPECFGFMGESATQTLEEAEEYDDQYLSMWKNTNLEDSKYPSSSLSLSSSLFSSLGDSSTAIPSINDEVVNKMIQETILQKSKATTVSSIAQQQQQQQQQPKVTSLLEGLRTIAQLSGLWISGGGIHIRTSPKEAVATKPLESLAPTKVYNTHVIIDPNGRLQAHYHKIHLFDVENIPDKQQQEQQSPKQVSLQESATTIPGTEYVICPNTPLGTLGLSICYDVRFPEQYTMLRQMGADILLVPSAFTVPTGQAGHWHVLLQARAIETQCYVIAAAQYGRHNHKRTSFGHAIIIDPWGTILADAGGYNNHDRHHDENEIDNYQSSTNTSTSSSSSSTSLPLPPPSIITAPIDLEYVQKIRRRIPIESHRAIATAVASAATTTTTTTTTKPPL